MDYVKIYKQLCERGKIRNREDIYVEKHHIIPTFFYKNPKRKVRYRDGILDGNGEHSSNISFLTPREHFLAHYLLYKIFYRTKWGHRCGSSLLLFFVKTNGKHKRSSEFTPTTIKKYEKINKELRKKQSDEMRGKIIVRDKDTMELIGKVSNKHPNVLSGKWVHHSTGRIVPEYQLVKYRFAVTGNKNPNYKYIEIKWICEAVHYVFNTFITNKKLFCEYNNKIYLCKKNIIDAMAEYINENYLKDKRKPVIKLTRMIDGDIERLFNAVLKTDIFIFERYFRGYEIYKGKGQDEC